MYVEKTFGEKLRTFATFALVPMFAFTAVLLIPFLTGLLLTFTNWNGIAPIDSFNYEFVGLQNYAAALSDPSYLNTLALTFLYMILVVIITNVVAFLFALLVTTQLPMRNFFRATFFMPNLIGGVLLGFIWQFVFATLLPSIGDLTGIPLFQNNWLVQTNTAFAAMVIVSVWQLSGYMMLIYIASLVGIPQEVLEASQIDGASALQQMFRIKIPLMMPAFTISIFLTLRNSFMMFDVNLALTDGGPFRSTELVTLHIYNEAFIGQKFGPGQAQAVILFVIVAVVAVSQVLISKRLESRAQ